MKMAHRLSIVPLALAVWAGVSLACAGIIPKSIPPETSTAVVDSQAPATPSSKLGEIVEQFGYSLSATKVEYPTSQNTFEAPKQGHKKVAIEITLGNVSGAEALCVLYNYAYLVDSNGFVYEASYGYGDNTLDMVYLNIGEKVKGWVYFIIPESATPAYIKYKTNYSGDYESFLMAGLTE